jgi:hypothetical protein
LIVDGIEPLNELLCSVRNDRLVKWGMSLGSALSSLLSCS